MQHNNNIDAYEKILNPGLDENTSDQSRNRVPEDAVKSAEAMVAMAERLKRDSQSQTEQALDDIRIKEAKIQGDQQQSAKRHEPQKFNIGPKYLEAISKLTSVADIRAIEVELPILRTKATISPMTSAEEQALKTAAVSPETFLKKLNEIIFRHAEFQGVFFDSFEDFLSKLFPPDKQILIWGLLSASYLTIPTLEKQCENCGTNYLVDSTPADMMQLDTIQRVWDKELPPSEDRIIQQALDGYITFELGMPSEKQKLIVAKLLNPEKAKNNVEQTGTLMSYTDNLIFFTKAIIVGEGQDRTVLTDLIHDIAPFLKNLPPKIADAVKTSIDLTIYEEYMPRFYIKSTCKNCGTHEEIDIDPELAFFRKTISL